jgi:hypothetical protein
VRRAAVAGRDGTDACRCGCARTHTHVYAHKHTQRRTKIHARTHTDIFVGFILLRTTSSTKTQKRSRSIPHPHGQSTEARTDKYKLAHTHATTATHRRTCTNKGSAHRPTHSTELFIVTGARGRARTRTCRRVGQPKLNRHSRVHAHSRLRTHTPYRSTCTRTYPRTGTHRLTDVHRQRPHAPRARATVGVFRRRATPLYRAASNGHKAVLEILFTHGADVNAKADGHLGCGRPLVAILSNSRRAPFHRGRPGRDRCSEIGMHPTARWIEIWMKAQTHAHAHTHSLTHSLTLTHTDSPRHAQPCGTICTIAGARTFRYEQVSITFTLHRTRTQAH